MCTKQITKKLNGVPFIGAGYFTCEVKLSYSDKGKPFTSYELNNEIKQIAAGVDRSGYSNQETTVHKKSL